MCHWIRVDKVWFLRFFKKGTHSLNPIQTRGRRKVPALTLNANNFFKIQPNAAKLCEFILNLSGNNLVGQVVVSGT